MSSVRQLYELQEIDLAIARNRESLAKVESQIGEDSDLVKARLGLEEERKQLADLLKRQKEMEWEIEELSVKITAVDEKLYGGSVKNPKELASLSEECDHFKAHRRELEDRVLEIMSDVESAQNRVDVKKREVEGVEAEWQAEQAQLLEQQAQLNDELAKLDEDHRLLVSQIDRNSVGLYEELRGAGRSESVAKVEQGMCQGCRINLPMSKLQRARMGQELVQCSNCGRILYVI